jgi:hypothetical protein
MACTTLQSYRIESLVPTDETGIVAEIYVRLGQAISMNGTESTEDKEPTGKKDTCYKADYISEESPKAEYGDLQDDNLDTLDTLDSSCIP